MIHHKLHKPLSAKAVRKLISEIPPGFVEKSVMLHEV